MKRLRELNERQWHQSRKKEPTQPGVTGEPALTGSRVVELLFGPNSPTAHTFHDRGFVNFDVLPFKNGRPDQQREPWYIEDFAEWQIINVTVNQDVGRRELGNDWYAVRNKRKIYQVALF